MKKQKGFRSALAIFLAMLLIMTSMSVPAFAQGEATAEKSFSEQFEHPEGLAKPYIRWWVLPGMMNEEETKAEVRKMAEAGFGGIELVAIVSLAPFGSAGWNNAMKWALEEAIECGIQLDFTIGQGWPVKTPAVSDADDIRAEQGLFYKNVDFTAAEDAMVYEAQELPLPDKQFEAGRPYELVAVTAAKKTGDASYDPATAVNITDAVDGESVKWIAPETGDWTVFFLYRQGINSAGGWGASDPVVDHFSADATQAVLDYWDSNMMGDDYLRSLYEQNGGSIFCDSLEIGQASKDLSAFWTADMLEQFKARRGYDLTPYLPTLFIAQFYPCYSHRQTMDGTADFEFDGVGYQIREDFYKTLTELFTENHVRKIADWTHEHNMTLRYQVYGAPMDTTSPFLNVDIVETESWGNHDVMDAYRLQSGVVHMTGRSVYSTESSAVQHMPWAQTWTGSYHAGGNAQENYWRTDGGNYVYTENGNEDAGFLYHMNRQFATGVNRAVMHGFSYKSAMMQQWPGDSFMSMGNFPNEWDDKTPMWEHVKELTDYLRRTQFVLQQGQADIDLAVYRIYYYDESPNFDFASNAIEKAGYTYDYAAPDLLRMDNATAGEQDGKTVLAADGPSYKALVLDQRKVMNDEGGLTASDMPLDVAQKILGYAKAGLPIVIVGDAPDQVDTFAGSAEAMAGQNEQLAAIMSEIKALSTTVTVAAQDDVPAALQQLGVQPDAERDSASALLNFHRTDNNAEYYYLYNSDLNNSLTQTVSLKGEGTPYLLDSWSGKITPIAQYQAENGRVTLTIELEPNANLLIAIAKDGFLGDAPSNSVADTNADAVVYDADGNLAARVTDAGEYSFTFDNGAQSTVALGGAPDAFKLDGWTMTLESWSAGVTALETLKTEMGPYELNQLVPWNEIEGLEDAAGVATYTTSFRMDEGWESGLGATLKFDYVSDTMKLWVNGNEVAGVDQLSKIVDIGAYLIPGENTLQVEVTSNLANIKSKLTQEFGLVGAVTVTPYRQTVLSAPEAEPMKSVSAPASAQVNTAFDVTVVTSASVTDVRLFNENDMAIGRKNVAVNDNEDGTKTWTITVALGTVGDARELKVVTKGAEGYLTDSGKNVSIDITSIPPVLMGFDLPETAVANRTFIVKATTDMEAAK
ncbi:MAG: hypothetical protein HFE85_05410, partial [Clostridiales bacterium]|nr:hypothetical protein [Clostridiales bacterium]